MLTEPGEVSAHAQRVDSVVHTRGPRLTWCWNWTWSAPALPTPIRSLRSASTPPQGSGATGGRGGVSEAPHPAPRRTPACRRDGRQCYPRPSQLHEVHRADVIIGARASMVRVRWAPETFPCFGGARRLSDCRRYRRWGPRTGRALRSDRRRKGWTTSRCARVDGTLVPTDS